MKLCSYSVYCGECFLCCHILIKSYFNIQKINFFINSKFTYYYPIEELDSVLKK